MRTPRPPLTDDQRALTITYGWGVAWALLYALATPSQTLAVFLQPAVYLWTAAVAASGVAALWGVRHGNELLLERHALSVMRWSSLAFPLSTLVVLIIELATSGHSERWHVLLLGAWPFWIMRKRALFLRRKADEARATPLPREVTR
jgi:hypothetical protein